MENPWVIQMEGRVEGAFLSYLVQVSGQLGGLPGPLKDYFWLYDGRFFSAMLKIGWSIQRNLVALRDHTANNTSPQTTDFETTCRKFFYYLSLSIAAGRPVDHRPAKRKDKSDRRETCWFLKLLGWGWGG